MSRPRSVLPGKTYLITRRVTQRECWLKPTALTNQIVLYCIAYAAMLFGVKVHALIVMSNHLHAVITDVEGRYPEFLHRMYLLISKCINPAYGRWENLWNNSQPSVVELCDEGSIIKKVLYTLNNPTDDGLLEHSDDWPGLRTTPEDWTSAPYEVERPKVYFSETGVAPERVYLQISRPPVMQHLTDSEVAEDMRDRLRADEATLRDARFAEGGTFLGIEAILGTAPSAAPSSTPPRRTLSPRFSAQSRAVLVRAIQAAKAWLSAYRQSRNARIAGDHNVLFPAGTWALRDVVNVAPAPT